MSSTRENKIADAVGRGAELIAALMERGSLNSQQASLIIRAAVRAAVPNAEFWEICAVAREIVADLAKHAQPSPTDSCNEQTNQTPSQSETHSARS